jgi:D-3-phosphoglycerate dehydrogenase / 2-oxoglutarate reductase
MKYEILNTIGNNYPIEAKKILSKLGNVCYVNIAQEELLKNIVKYNIVIIGLGLNFNKSILEKAKNLKIIATITTGLDHIDLKVAKKLGIEVISLKEDIDFLRTITGTAELAFGLLLDLVRNISISFESVKQYEWDREKFKGNNLADKTLGILGYGRLGKMMAQYGKAFGMNIIVCDPYVESIGIENVNFEVFLQKSDVISIHVHLNDETINMFDVSAFKKMKKTACLINTSRGKIINEKDVLKALEYKEISGYATDVLDGELDFTENGVESSLIDYAKKNKNMIITPHIGGMTEESRISTDVFMAKKVLNYIMN